MWRLLSVLLTALAFPVAAQNYPTKTVKIIVPYPAGGNADNFARTIAQKLNESYGQILIVDGDPAVHTEMHSYFGPRGFEVSSASSGTDGLARFFADRPDAVLLEAREHVAPEVVAGQRSRVAVAVPVLPTRSFGVDEVHRRGARAWRPITPPATQKP